MECLYCKHFVLNNVNFCDRCGALLKDYYILTVNTTQIKISAIVLLVAIFIFASYTGLSLVLFLISWLLFRFSTNI